MSSDGGTADLRADNARDRSIIDAMSEGVVVQDGGIVDCNRAAEEILELGSPVRSVTIAGRVSPGNEVRLPAVGAGPAPIATRRHAEDA